jgi:hypothetical protein
VFLHRAQPRGEWHALRKACALNSCPLLTEGEVICLVCVCTSDHHPLNCLQLKERISSPGRVACRNPPRPNSRSTQPLAGGAHLSVSGQLSGEASAALAMVMNSSCCMPKPLGSGRWPSAPTTLFSSWSTFSRSTLLRPASLEPKGQQGK